ncbi:MAG: hypothetical protein U5O39_05460 [Gammaproteobacteria bacterium]|nr:hypothetical protein [Gammaproteobacteria bacterium]
MGRSHMNLEYSGYEEYNKYYIYNFEPVATSDNVLVAMRLENCGHSVAADAIQADFFRIFSQQDREMSQFRDEISQDTDMTFCERQRLARCRNVEEQH